MNTSAKAKGNLRMAELAKTALTTTNSSGRARAVYELSHEIHSLKTAEAVKIGKDVHDALCSDMSHLSRYSTLVDLSLGVLAHSINTVKKNAMSTPEMMALGEDHLAILSVFGLRVDEAATGAFLLRREAMAVKA